MWGYRSAVQNNEARYSTEPNAKRCWCTQNENTRTKSGTLRSVVSSIEGVRADIQKFVSHGN
jgi:hypothetical protein